MYGKFKAKDIASKLNLTLNQVYDIAKRNNITNKQNQTFNINYLQEQIILGGILGDGRLKRNGKSNYYYSECHSLQEKEYCLWKYNQLGELTSNMKPYGKNLNNEHNDAIEFCTKTTPTLIKYANMSQEEVLERMDKEALIILLLDDGCFNNHSKKGNFVLASDQYTQEFRNKIIEKYNNVLKTNAHQISIKRPIIAFSSNDNNILYNAMVSFIPTNLDIVQKKFGHIIKTNQI